MLAAQGVSEYTILIIFSALFGIVAGFAAVGFHAAIGFLTNIFWKGDPGRSYPMGWVIAIPALGMFLQWLMTQKAPKQASERGVIEIIKAVSIRNGDIPLKTTLFHFLAPVINISTGGTVGPEAPAAQSGAGAVSAVSKFLGLSESRRRIFTAAGAGAAIAGVFNTPLAGVFFSIEIILLGDFHASAITAFLLSSVSASIVSRAYLGNEPRFFFGDVNLGPYSLFVFYLLLGIGAGLFSIAFIRSEEWFKTKFSQWYKHVPTLWGMLAVGVLMGIAGWMIPEIFGIGYKAINGILSGTFPASKVAILLGLKFILVILILSAGGFGGIFAPSIFLGACYGYLFALFFSHLLNVSLDPTTYTLVGMGAVLAGINSVPITAIMILFEMTDNYHFILPLMLGVVGAHVVSNLALNGSIYQRELRRLGYRFSAGRETRVLRSILVEQVVRLGITTVPESAPLSEVIRLFLEESKNTIYTVDKNNRISGVITSSTLRHILRDLENLQGMLIAQDIADPNVTVIDAEENLEEAMRIFVRKRVEEIPVIYHRKKDKILGTLHYQDILSAYNQAITALSVKDALAADLKSVEEEEIAEVIPGFSMTEVEVPDHFVGKTIEQLRLRNKHKVDVLMVTRENPFDVHRSQPERIMPDKNFMLRKGDRLTIYGRTLDVIRFVKLASGEHRS